MPSPTTESPPLSPAPRAGRARPRGRLTPRAAIPLVLLLLALSTEFLLGDERGHTYRGSVHNGVTANHMAVARNLSPKHGFLGFYSLTLDDHGDLAYRPYNRFPIGGYLLLKLAMSPFGDDFSSEILAARTLMRAFFVLSAVSAYLALCRIVASRWVALAATLTAFSSFHLLYYNDMVATESMPSLFGVLLAFHGMVVFVQEGRFRQLLVKACAALLLGWHVYALLIAFIVLGLARELVGALPLFPRFGRSDQERRGEAAAPGRCLALGAVALLFGAALLSFNLGNEYIALGGRVPLTELPTAGSMAHRLGAHEIRDAAHAEQAAWLRYLNDGNRAGRAMLPIWWRLGEWEWLPFLEEQFQRIGVMTLPYGWIEPIWASVVERALEARILPGVFTWGIVASGVCLMGLPFVRHGLLLAALALSGFCWALLVRHNAEHEYEAVFHVGIPLTVFSFVFLCTRRLIGDRFVPVLAAIALPAYILSSVEMADVGIRGFEAAAEAEMRRDFEVIRDVSGESVLYYPPFLAHYYDVLPAGLLKYYLAGSVILGGLQWRQREMADVVMLPHRDEGPALLTPDNRRMFLYDRALYDASYDEPALGRPIIASDWNVYRKDDRLIYVREGCTNRQPRFFLSPTPREADDPLGREDRRGFDGEVFRWERIARRSARRCVGVIELPERDLASVRTGQLRDGEPLWEGEYRFER